MKQKTAKKWRINGFNKADIKIITKLLFLIETRHVFKSILKQFVLKKMKYLLRVLTISIIYCAITPLVFLYLCAVTKV